MIEMEKQVQKAGDNAQQLQVVIQGIDEKRVREVFKEMYEIVKKDFSQDAYMLASERVDRFEEKFVPKIMKIEGAMEMFSDPSFQFLLGKAHKTAAATEREADYDMLSELLIHRVKRGENRNKRAGINRAVEILDQVSDDALLGLTVAFVVMNFIPLSGNMSEGLSLMDDLFKKLLYGKLPIGGEWIEHLDLLDAVRISSLQSFKKMEEYYVEVLPGYACAGIKKGTESYDKARELLKKEGIPENILVDNELLEGYVRLPVVDANRISDVVMCMVQIADGHIVPIEKKFSANQQKVLKQIWNLYDKTMMEEARKAIEKKLDEYSSIKRVKRWWNAITVPFSVTAVGKVLAHANAKRCDEKIPDLD